MHAKFCPENLDGRNYLGNLGVGGRMILIWMKEGVKMWTRFICLITGTSDGLL